MRSRGMTTMGMVVLPVPKRAGTGLLPVPRSHPAYRYMKRWGREMASCASRLYASVPSCCFRFTCLRSMLVEGLILGCGNFRRFAIALLPVDSLIDVLYHLADLFGASTARSPWRIQAHEARSAFSSEGCLQLPALRCTNHSALACRARCEA